MKKTPLQKLIEIIKSSKQEVDVQGMGICEVLDYHGIEDMATELLEEEKQMVIDSWIDSEGRFFDAGTEIIEAEKYFNETYQNKEDCE